MENPTPSNDWTYGIRWHRYPVSLIETNGFEINISLYVILFIILFATIWCKDNSLIIYLYILVKKLEFFNIN